MRRLTLIRHAKSSWADADLTDFERPLNERGLRDAPRMAAQLHELLGVPDRLVSSPAKRAISTARIFATHFGLDLDAIAIEPRIYEASLPTLLRVVGELDAADRHVMLFGHNPGFSELAHQLAKCPFDAMPTCAAVQLELSIDEWSEAGKVRAKLRHYVYPKGLRD